MKEMFRVWELIVVLFLRSAGCIFAELVQNRILFSKNNVIFKRDSVMNENEEQFKLIVMVRSILLF
jgi:hypothetical protein